MADDPFLSPSKGHRGISLAQREFRRREIVRGLVAVGIGLTAVGGLLMLFGLAPLGSNAVGRGDLPQRPRPVRPQAKVSAPGLISLEEQLLPVPSPRVRGSVGAPFVVPAGQVHRPVIRPDLSQPPSAARWNPAPSSARRPASHPIPRPPRRQVPAVNLVPVYPQQRGDALEPPEAPLETTPE